MSENSVDLTIFGMTVSSFMDIPLYVFSLPWPIIAGFFGTLLAIMRIINEFNKMKKYFKDLIKRRKIKELVKNRSIDKMA